MAKKRKGKIKILLSKPDNSNVVRLSKDELPAYHHFVDAPDDSFRLFFETPKSSEETRDPDRKGKKFFRTAINYKVFKIMVNGKSLVGDNIARTFAVLLSKKILNGSIGKSQPCSIEHTTLNSFFSYIASLKDSPSHFSQINISHLSGWLSQTNKGSSGTYKYTLKSLIDLHPLSSELDISLLRYSKKDTVKSRLSEIDFDDIVKSNDYSEKVLFQILCYVYFEIENAENRLNTFEQASPSDLGDDYIPPDKVNVKNHTIKRLLETGDAGFNKLAYHFYFYLTHPSTGTTNKALSTFRTRIKQISEFQFKGSNDPLENFYKFEAYYKSSLLNNWPLKEGTIAAEYPFLSLASKHHEVAIFFYSLITLGVNKEVALSWQCNVNGIPWYENYDIELGISKKTGTRDRKIVLDGMKMKGLKPIRVKKSISINCPLFKYLKLLDRTRSADRQYIFNIPDIEPYATAFLRQYPVINDDGSRLKTIETRRFRKTYTGYKTFDLLKGVNNSDELVSQLQIALNHKSFDTTFSSYIMKSGMSRTVLDSAIIALTTNMLESAMAFNGEIKEDNERTDDNQSVFLCDCTDPTKPTHGLPIAERCMKYDMCLGCERSEVYSEHLPAICYRILQYELKQEEDPSVFKINLEDRMYIAIDTVEKFKSKHSNGIQLAEQAYEIANKSMLDGDPLLPPILQIGAL